MPQKVGSAGQILNFNWVHEFVAENLNKLLWKSFTPGVLEFTYTTPPLPTEIEITNFSGLVRPKNQNFLIKVDTHTSLKIVADPNKPYLVARMDWLTPPNGYDYETTSYGISGYSGYFDNSTVSCTMNPAENKIISTNHDLSVGDVLRFTETVAGVIKNTDYYVTEVDSTNTFKVSLTSTGTAITITSSLDIVTSYRKLNSHIVRFDMLSESELDTSYDVILALLIFTGNTLTSVDTSDQTQVYLNDNCINYNLLQRSGIRTLDGTNPDYIDYNSNQIYVGNASGNIPLSNSVQNINLNAQYLNGITASNLDNSISLKNNILSKNTVAARVFLNNYEYAIGQSGLLSYSGFSGYTGISGWSGASGFSAYSGYVPINNTILQTSLNAEYLGGYKLENFSLSGHTHDLDKISDGTTYARIIGVDTDGLLTTESISDKTLEYRHQSTTTPFRYDTTAEKKIFMLAGEIGLGGSSGVTFRKTFNGAPRVFLLNNETDEWKAVKEADIISTGFIITHDENTSGTDLVSDTTEFSTHWLACGELL